MQIHAPARRPAAYRPDRGESARDYGWEDLHDAYAERLVICVHRKTLLS
jgi:hypothetical protein